MMNETYNNYYITETKRQSKEWITKGESTPKKAQNSLLVVKVFVYGLCV